MTLDELKDYLDSDANVHGLDSIATHGFLTATVVGKSIPNWMSLMFEGEDTAVDDDVKNALTNWRLELLEEIKSEEGIELPLELEDEDGELDFSAESELTAWSIGFVDAMYGDGDTDWFANDTDGEDTEEDVAMLTLPMVLFSGIDSIDGEEDSDLASIRADEDTVVQMANNIEGNLSELFLLFNTDD